MEKATENFLEYMKIRRHASKNTMLSYKHDLEKAGAYLREERGVLRPEEVSSADLTCYIKELEKNGKSDSTISRSIASLKSFFGYIYGEKLISVDPARELKAPKVIKNPSRVSDRMETERERLLGAPVPKTPKGIRDKAMLELLCSTGIKVSELIGLKLKDVDTENEYISCGDEKLRCVPYNKRASKYLKMYAEEARSSLCGENVSESFFVNCSGLPMSRQGFWKILKKYGESVGLNPDITSYALRHSTGRKAVKRNI